MWKVVLEMKEICVVISYEIEQRRIEKNRVKEEDKRGGCGWKSCFEKRAVNRVEQ